MAKYSQEFKENIVKRKLSGQAVSEIAADVGICNRTIYGWLKKAKNGILNDDGSDYPGSYSLNKKFDLLITSISIAEKDKGEWMRQNGVHPDHLKQWRLDIQNSMTTPKQIKEENKQLKLELKRAEKELRKKDKALAEAAALLVLKKKYQHLWEDEGK